MNHAATHSQPARCKEGAVREVVTRTLTRLQEQGLINLNGKNILIPDTNVLAAYAESEG